MAAAGCEEGPLPPPLPSYIVVTPAEALLAPGDSTELSVHVFSADDERIDIPVTFHVDDLDVGRVDEAGVLGALAPGVTRVVAREAGGVQGQTTLEVAFVTGFSPPNSAPGGILTIRGANFGAQTRAFFGATSGPTRTVASDGRTFESWVPFGVPSGPLTVVLADGQRITTNESFFLTGDGDDALEPNDFDVPVDLSVPYENPFLLSLVQNMDYYTISLNRPAPLTISVSDREEINTWNQRLTLQVNHAEDFEEVVGIAPVFAFEGNQRIDGVISRELFPVGDYAIRIFVAPGNGAVDRRYEITVDTLVTHAVAADSYEPNDWPLEAPLIGLPFVDSMSIENPWAVDYFTIRVGERSKISMRLRHSGGSKGLFFLQDDRSVLWSVSNGVRPLVWRGVIAPFGEIELDCTELAGEYRIGVLENGGLTGRYELEVTAEPFEGGFFNCRQPQLGVPDAATGLMAARP